MMKDARAKQTHAADARPRFDPDWALDAVWYQIFPTRFHNGDPANDKPETWPWNPSWLKQPPANPPTRKELFLRRYGGDLQGILQRLNYLRDLGVNTLYLNPVFAAETEHKYDTSDYRHIDDTLGVAGAMGRLHGETDDPRSWQWSESDLLFRRLLKAAHQRGMRVVIDGVFNHAGQDFWAFQDVQQKGRDSAYADWFDITDFGPPMQWNAWDGPNGHLVEFRQAGDGFPEAVEQHLFAITRRWMDPDGDGDAGDGVDGWRLDAAEKVPHGYWKRWRSCVKSINPDAIILGEIWIDPAPWLGDQFDVVTNYRLSETILDFLKPEAKIRDVTDFADRINALTMQFATGRTLALANLLDSHDTARLLTQMSPPFTQAERKAISRRDPHRPQRQPVAQTFERAKLAVLLQFTLPGAPMIYNGAELGMVGEDDPYCRAPMDWPDIQESNGQAGDESSPPPRPRHTHRAKVADLRAFYRRLIEIYDNAAALRRGHFRLLLADDARRCLVFDRILSGQRYVVCVNASSSRQSLMVNLGRAGLAAQEVLRSASTGEPAPGDKRVSMTDADGLVEVVCPKWGAAVLKVEHPWCNCNCKP